MNPSLLLNGHIDVVPAGEEEFNPQITEDCLVGRGAGDMKGHVVSMILALKEFVELNKDKNIALLLTSDEEVGGKNGTRHVLELGLRPQRVFIPDAMVNFDIVRSQKAPHHFHVRAKGKGGHSSRAFELDNPFNKIWDLYREMRKKYAVATPENDWASTFELTVMEAEDMAANKIPDQASAWFSWRWPLEHFSFEEGVEDFQRLCEQYGLEILDDQHGFGEGFLIDEESNFIKLWQDIASKLTNKPIGFKNEHSASDARHFHAYDIPVLITSAEAGNFHTEGEWINIQSLVLFTQAIYQLLNSI